MEGSEAIAESMIAAGCRFFAGYPMTPFTEVLEHMARKLPSLGGHCINAESEIEAVGMAWGAAATGTSGRDGFDRPGSLAHAGVALGDHPRPGAARRAQHGPRPGRLLPGHPGRWPRRLPAPGPRPDGRPEAVRAGAARVRPGPSSGATRSWSSATTTSPTSISRSRSSRSTSAPCRRGTGHSTGRPGGRGTRSSSPRSATSKQRDDVGYDLQALPTCAERLRPQAMLDGEEPLVETGFLDDAEVVVVAFGTPAKYVRVGRAVATGRGSPGRLRATHHSRARSPRRRSRRPPEGLMRSPSTRTTRVR